MSSTTEAPKRPPTSATKPKAPSFMKPTSSTLNKPPARPTSSAAIRKTPAIGPVTPASARRKNASITSAEEAAKSGASGDERKRSSIAKPAKRMSLAGSTVPGHITVKPTSEISDRRSTIQPSHTKERKPIGRATTLSPTKATKPPTTPSTRTPIGGVSRLSRPVTSSLRSAGVSEGKKRLSTIPASPAVKIEADPSRDDKKNANPADFANSTPKRPALGTRKSTRSVVMESQLREFELVQNMLQIAAAAEDAGDEAGLSKAEDQVAEKMDKLRENMAKIRAFEKRHGRKPTESELEDGIDFKVEEEDKTNALVDTERELATVAAASANEANEEVFELKTLLSERQAQIESLLAELANMRSWLKESGDSSDGDAEHSRSSKKAIRREHAAKVDDLVTSHEEEVAALRRQITDSETRETKLLEQTRVDLEASKAAEAEAGNTKMAAMLQQQEQKQVLALNEIRERLEQHKAQAADADREHEIELAALREGAEAQDQEMAEHEQKLATLEDELSGKSTTIRSFQTELAELQESKDQVARELKVALESGASGSAVQQEIIDGLKKNSDAVKSEHKAELESVRGQVEERDKDLLDAQTKNAALERGLSDKDISIKSLQDELDAVEQSKKQLASELEITRHSGNIAVAAANEEQDALRRELEVARSNIKTSLEEEQLAQQKKDDEIVGLNEVVEKLQDEIRKVHQMKSDEKDSDLLRLGKEHEDLQKHMTDLDQQHHTQLSQKEREHAEVVADMTDQHRKALGAMSKKHKEDMEDAMASMEKVHNAHLEAALEDSLNSARSEHEQGVTALEAAFAKWKEDYETLSTRLRTEAEISERRAQENITTLEEELAARKAQAGHDGSSLKTAQDDLEASRSQVTSLQQMLESMTEESSIKAGHQAEEIQKAKAEAEEAARALSEHSSEVESARKSHQDALQSIETDHEAEIESLRSEIALQNETAISQLQAQHDEALNSIRNEMNMAHTRQMEDLETSLETKYKSQVGDAATMVTELHEKHETEMARVLEDARNATQQQLRNQLEEHEAKLAKAVEDARISTKAEVHLELDQQHEAARLSALAELRDELESQHKSDLGEARAAAETGHQKELLTITAAAFAADKAITQTNKETDALRKDLQAALDRAKAAELRADQHGESGKAELVMLKDQLDGALLEAETQRQIADQRSKDLEALKNSQQQIAEQVSTEVDALKKHHEMALDSSKTKIIELESSLKVTKAELTEAKTQRAIGINFLNSPSGKINNSPSSNWAEAQPFTPSKKAGQGGDPDSDRSHITQGKLAGLVEDSRQLQEISHDFQEDHER